MAMNLRLPDDLAAELRQRSEITGKSQQEIVRSALETYLHDALRSDLSPWLRANIRPPIGPHVPLSTDRRVTGSTGSALAEALLSDRAAR
ncbi:MAG: ribbon-helix-helix protein, CopG family [Actinobacteria bacterium]|nr:ribbon-helix-helix protein, CopG family [Actinomycetota bacterium]